MDLPGYGFARAPEAVRQKWEGYINSYLRRREDLVGVVQLIDMRTGPTPDDLRSVDFLAEMGIPVLFAFTKADKLTATKRKEALAEAVKTLQVEPDQVIAFSALKGDGRDELLETLGSLLFPAPDEAPPMTPPRGMTPRRDPMGTRRGLRSLVERRFSCAPGRVLTLPAAGCGQAGTSGASWVCIPATRRRRCED